MQQRYYDPVAGRFLSVDPVATDGNTGASFNRYAYAGNNPYKNVDPDGRNGITAFGGLITESWNAVSGRGFDGDMVAGALADGYNGDGDGAFSAALGDAAAVAALATGGTGALRSLASMALKAVVKQDRPSGVPKDWAKSPSNKGGGDKFTNPANKHDQVRSMPGNPRSPNEAQQTPYVTRQADGKSYDVGGKEVPRSSPEAHIQTKDFKFIPKDKLNNLD